MMGKIEMGPASTSIGIVMSSFQGDQQDHVWGVGYCRIKYAMKKRKS